MIGKAKREGDDSQRWVGKTGGTEYRRPCHEQVISSMNTAVSISDTRTRIFVHSGGARMMVRVRIRPEPRVDLYQGSCLDDLPDLLVEWSDEVPTGSEMVGGGIAAAVRASSAKIGSVEGVNQYGRTGEHRLVACSSPLRRAFSRRGSPGRSRPWISPDVCDDVWRGRDSIRRSSDCGAAPYSSADRLTLSTEVESCDGVLEPIGDMPPAEYEARDYDQAT
jgi:hypothetical protein